MYFFLKVEVPKVPKSQKTNPKEKNKQENDLITELNPQPSYIQERNVLWEKFKASYETELAAKKTSPIKVTLPDGKVIDGESWRTSPNDIAQGIR